LYGWSVRPGKKRRNRVKREIGELNEKGYLTGEFPSTRVLKAMGKNPLERGAINPVAPSS